MHDSYIAGGKSVAGALLQSAPVSDLLTPREAASYLRMSVTWLYDHAAPARREPSIPCVRYRGEKRDSLVFRRADLDSFIAACLVGGKAEPEP